MSEFEDSQYINDQRDRNDRILEKKVRGAERKAQFSGDLNQRIWDHLSEVHGVGTGSDVSIPDRSGAYTGKLGEFNPTEGKVTIHSRIGSGGKCFYKASCVEHDCVAQLS